MDTETFDTEISVTCITKGYIEPSTYRIHRNMIKKLGNINSESVILVVLATSIIPVIFTFQQPQQIVQASNDNDNNNCAEKSLLAEIVCNGHEALAGYNEGVRDGKEAAANGQSNQCPQSDDLSGYCLGFGTGWNRVSDAQETLNDVNSNNNNDDDDDNDNDGNREDDGEFVPRTIGDSNKRTIGDNN